MTSRKRIRYIPYQTKLNIFMIFIFGVFGAFLATNAIAVSSVSVKVTILASSCTINGGNPIEVDFGNVITTQIDGVRYAQPLNFTIDCSDLPSNDMKLQFSGSGADFDNSSLRTTVTDLGVAFITPSGVKLPLNTGWQNFTYPTIPSFTVVPVQRSGASLPTGLFTAVATLVIQQQ